MKMAEFDRPIAYMTEVRMLCAGTDAILEKVQNATRLVNIGIKK